jgi:hypothetical protein
MVFLKSNLIADICARNGCRAQIMHFRRVFRREADKAGGYSGVEIRKIPCLRLNAANLTTPLFAR